MILFKDHITSGSIKCIPSKTFIHKRVRTPKNMVGACTSANGRMSRSSDCEKCALFNTDFFVFLVHRPTQTIAQTGSVTCANGHRAANGLLRSKHRRSQMLQTCASTRARTRPTIRKLPKSNGARQCRARALASAR